MHNQLLALSGWRIAEIILFLVFCLSFYPVNVEAQERPKFEKNVLVKGLKDPWSIVFGPDQMLWLTESKTYKVLRLDPIHKKVDTVADLSREREFPRYDNLPDSLQEGKPWPQGGLMGLAIHPEFLNDKPFIYLSMVYRYTGSHRAGDGRDPIDQGYHFKTKILRYTFSPSNNTLVDPRVICDSIPGSNDHNGGRLLIVSQKGQHYLFYSVGDMGAGQYSNAARSNRAQDANSYEGKVLRFYTEADTNDSWIPQDNPFGADNAVWSLGHRNPQGLAALVSASETTLYSSEHGPFSDDEINIIKKGANYGHPLVIGYADGNYNGLSAGVTDADSLPGPWNSTYPLIVDEVENAKRMGSYQDPLWSFNPTRNEILRTIAEQLRDGGQESPQWESIAPSGITVYDQSAIPDWNKSLLITSLKKGILVRLKLDEEGKNVLARTDHFEGQARYRDVVVSSDGKKIYLITDLSLVTSGPTEDNPESAEDRGAVIEFQLVD
ncbi:MAG TPA: PQQ-dependent sugar dehydrogenase [Cyclobacteriaceae bacterium]|nr:PQQ-dependent sugar dehydrogenase [Cyclobacteriaceae bacterium]